MALISVVIPVFNSVHTLTATVRSLQAQTWTRWEAFLVDDGSTDASLSMAQALASQDCRLHVLRNPGKGPSAARNFAGIQQAQGDILSFCDADDLWTPHKLTEVAGALLGDGFDASFGRVGFFTETPSCVTSRSSVPSVPLSLPMLLAENPVCTLSNLSVTREMFISLKGFREDMSHNEDLEFLVRLVGHGARVSGIQSDHVLYRTSPGGLSADISAMRESREEVIRVARNLGADVSDRARAGAEARYMRYLARRAMRLDHSSSVVRPLVAEGLRTEPLSFLTPLKRGLPTAFGGLAYPLLPSALRRFLFSR